MQATWVTPAGEQVGNALGYNTHRHFLKKHSESHIDFIDDADIFIHIVPADIYHHVPEKFNVLFTMWEASEIPTKYVKALNEADLIVVPSRFCKDLFKKYTNKPIEVCFEGVEAEAYPYYERIEPLYGQKFRMLWVGAPNPRKGYPSILQVAKMVEQTPDLELYIKTTVGKFDRAGYLKNLWSKRREIRRQVKEGAIPSHMSVGNMLKRAHVRHKKIATDGGVSVHGKHENVIFDTRKIPFEDLISLYNSAHLFLLPTMGEGWGLTLCEAMATGCPCIATAVTGCADFFDEKVGFPLRYDMYETYLDAYDTRALLFAPDTVDLVQKIIMVYHNYQKALVLGKRASERIHEKFTWKKSGERFAEVIRKHYSKQNFDIEQKRMVGV